MRRLRLARYVWAIAGALLVTACAQGSPDETVVDPAEAQETLSSFLEMLAAGDFDRAAALYGGPTDHLRAWDPEIDPEDAGALLEYGCDMRLLQCLPVRSIALSEMTPEGQLVFHVEFHLPDGTLFVRGPCCGATSTEMPDQSVFSFWVEPRAGGGYVILDLPPYVP